MEQIKYDNEFKQLVVKPILSGEPRQLRWPRNTYLLRNY